jgi:hypothetical protein
MKLNSVPRSVSGALLIFAEVLVAGPQVCLATLNPTLVASFDGADSASRVRVVGGKLVAEGVVGAGLALADGEYVEISMSDLLSSSQGTLSLWVRPHWGYYQRSGDDLVSHTFASFRWADPKGGYFALTDGWWEPAGSPYTYFVFNNQIYDHTRCTTKYREGEWTHLVAVWQTTEPASITLYVNGTAATTKALTPGVAYRPASPLYVGTSSGAPLNGSRWLDGDLDEVALYAQALTVAEVAALYLSLAPQLRPGYQSPIDRVLAEVPYVPARDEQGRILETRAIFDEGMGWVTREGAIKTIERIKRARFNVYVPCVWHGRGTRYPSPLGITEGDRKFDGDDPLAGLIEVAHANGIEVHPWFTVALRQRDFLREFYTPETPESAFDLHHPDFRDFIVGVITDVVKRYDIDGVNLDFIRTMGLCTCSDCRAGYARKFGRELMQDKAALAPNGALETHLQQWQDEVVEAIVQAVSARAKSLRPALVISVDGHPGAPGFAPNPEGRAEIRWASRNLVDTVFAMDYRPLPDADTFDVTRAAFSVAEKQVLLLGNYDSALDKAPLPRVAGLVASLVSYTQRRWPGAVGLYLYSMLSDEQVEALRSGPFAESAKPAWGRSGAPASVKAVRQ